MEIRVAASEDREQWLALRHAHWPERDLECQHREVDAALGGPRQRHVLVCEEDGRLSGFTELYLQPRDVGGGAPEAVLDALYVAPAARGRGIARALLDAAERWAAGRRAEGLLCELDPSDEAGMAALAGLGFGAPRHRVSLRRTIARPLELANVSEPAPALPGWSQATVAPRGSRGLLVFNLVMLVAACGSFFFSDVFSKDVVRGVVLPLLDVLFVIYFAALIAVMRYRRKADSSERIDRLWSNDD